MFWNDPNLYSVAFKDVPNVPTPFWGSMPRTFNPYFPPYVNPTFFAPPIHPFLHANPGLFQPPITPFLQGAPNFPWIDRTMTPYGYNVPMPYLQGYRPFGL